MKCRLAGKLLLRSKCSLCGAIAKYEHREITIGKKVYAEMGFYVHPDMFPDLLYHRINGGNTYNYEEDVVWALGQIKEEGLVPDIAMAWANLVPEEIRALPIVWLTEEIGKDGNGYAQWLGIRTDVLALRQLYKVDKGDVNWWVYQGLINFEAISIIDRW